MSKKRKTPQERLEALRAKEAQIKAQIAVETAKQKEKERKLDSRRKIVIGAAVLKHASIDPQFAELLDHVLNRAVTRDDDRSLLDLGPRGAAQAANESFKADEAG